MFLTVFMLNGILYGVLAGSSANQQTESAQASNWGTGESLPSAVAQGLPSIFSNTKSGAGGFPGFLNGGNLRLTGEPPSGIHGIQGGLNIPSGINSLGESGNSASGQYSGGSLRADSNGGAVDFTGDASGRRPAGLGQVVVGIPRVNTGENPADQLGANWGSFVGSGMGDIGRLSGLSRGEAGAGAGDLTGFFGGGAFGKGDTGVDATGGYQGGERRREREPQSGYTGGAEGVSGRFDKLPHGGRFGGHGGEHMGHDGAFKHGLGEFFSNLMDNMNDGYGSGGTSTCSGLWSRLVSFFAGLALLMH
ncbi:keratin, type I cytoskeletal 9-like [Paramacrobiotus metropolitanus]|uniref:keratin, type I cytoskeletal 9-like n=1 Tax=Paramacrobiotus metropolitanus TaxID=2943436 RepID=UPI0024455FAE|nr:keratin, type I cytoskeletal 9-like [Paramacrobiotus metropolitanus]